MAMLLDGEIHSACFAAVSRNSAFVLATCFHVILAILSVALPIGLQERRIYEEIIC
jgi:hypothetical protein